MSAHAIERVVILTPAVADILVRLGASESVVGVTRNVTDFPDAVSVGTHLNPGVENMAALRPTLLIVPAGFNADLARRMGAAHFVYAPRTLRDIIRDVLALGTLLGKETEAKTLADSLENILAELKSPKPMEERPTVLYETRSKPLAVARDHTIMVDILETAGLRYAYPDSAGIISAEYLLANAPDYYIYQEGPMNIDPVPPARRPGWGGFRGCAWKVDEFSFARPNTTSFETVRQLNAILTGEAPCAAGRLVYPEDDRPQ